MNDHDQYENVCKREFAEIKASLDKFYAAIFEGNGEPGLKAQVQMHARFLQGLIWFGGIVISALVWLVIEVHFKK
jgi:hypothetical protein